MQEAYKGEILAYHLFRLTMNPPLLGPKRSLAPPPGTSLSAALLMERSISAGSDQLKSAPDPAPSERITQPKDPCRPSDGVLNRSKGCSYVLYLYISKKRCGLTLLKATYLWCLKHHKEMQAARLEYKALDALFRQKYRQLEIMCRAPTDDQQVELTASALEDVEHVIKMRVEFAYRFHGNLDGEHRHEVEVKLPRLANQIRIWRVRAGATLGEVARIIDRTAHSLLKEPKMPSIGTTSSTEVVASGSMTRVNAWCHSISTQQPQAASRWLEFDDDLPDLCDDDGSESSSGSILDGTDRTIDTRYATIEELPDNDDDDKDDRATDFVLPAWAIKRERKQKTRLALGTSPSSSVIGPSWPFEG